MSKKCRDLEIGIRGHSRSLKVVPFGTMAFFFSDIQCRKMSWPWNRGQRSLKVIESCTIR